MEGLLFELFLNHLCGVLFWGCFKFVCGKDTSYWVNTLARVAKVPNKPNPPDFLLWAGRKRHFRSLLGYTVSLEKSCQAVVKQIHLGVAQPEQAIPPPRCCSNPRPGFDIREGGRGSTLSKSNTPASRPNWTPPPGGGV